MTFASNARQVVILDRDGTIVVDRHYLSDPAELEFTPNAVGGLQAMHRAGFRLIVITNQSGIGRGFLSVEQVERVNSALRDMMWGIGVPLHGIYYCPHTPEAACYCRKPASGLLLRAAREFGFEPASVFVVGDKLSDVEFGERVGARTMLIADNYAVDTSKTQPSYVVRDLGEAAQLMLSNLSEKGICDGAC